MRLVIVGAGVIGLLAAVEAVSAGHDVVLVDQAAIPNPGAASCDRHRVIRALHVDDPAATVAAVQAHHRWLELADLLGTPCYHQVGALSVVPAAHLERAAAMLAQAGAPARVLDPGTLAARYPHVGFPAGASAVLEPHAGVLLADRILATGTGWLRWHPAAQLRPHRTVASVDADRATVRFADGEVLAGDAVLLATGAWSRALLPDTAGLVLYRQSMLYCAVPAADCAAWSATPAVAATGSGGAWLVPPVAGTPLKLSAPAGCRAVPDIDDHSTPDLWRDRLVELFAATVPGFHAGWLVDTRDCYYLARSTGGPLRTDLGVRVVAYPACGGSSFKFAPLIARSLVDRLVRTGPRRSRPRPAPHPVMRGVS